MICILLYAHAHLGIHVSNEPSCIKYLQLTRIHTSTCNLVDVFQIGLTMYLDGVVRVIHLLLIQYIEETAMKERAKTMGGQRVLINDPTQS